MTKNEKTLIAHLRRAGLGYSKIASQLGISENTIKSYCKRNKLNGVANEKTSAPIVCLHCGELIDNSAKTKPRKFCSDSCRINWWNAHSEAVTKKATYKLSCGYCERAFYSYGNLKRKYCSRSCYGLSKRKIKGEAL